MADDMVTPEEEAMDARRRHAQAQERAARPRLNTSRKGKVGERSTVKLFEAAGIAARRQPRSGSIEGLPHDVIATLADGHLTTEVKRRKTSGWKTLEKWRDGADVLVLIEDQQQVGVPAPEPRVYMPWSVLLRFINHR